MSDNEPKVTLDPAFIRATLSAAILNTIDVDQRDILIKGAIAHLMTPRTTGTGLYQSKTTPLEDAFNEAVRLLAHKTAYEYLEHDETVQTNVKELISAAFEKVMSDNREKIVDKIAQAIAEGLVGRY